MRIDVDQNAYTLRSLVLVKQLVSDTFEVLEQYGLFKPEQNKEVPGDLLFRIFSVLDGSSYPGTLDDREIAPFVGFYAADELGAVILPEDGGSGMHGFVNEVVDAY